MTLRGMLLIYYAALRACLVAVILRPGWARRMQALTGQPDRHW